MSNKGKTRVSDLTGKAKAKVEKPAHQSAWLFTINTNKRFEDGDKTINEEGNKLKDCLNGFFEDKNKLLGAFTWRSKNHDYDKCLYEFEIEKSTITKITLPMSYNDIKTSFASFKCLLF